MTACGFTLQHYEECLKLAQSKGYSFLTMSDWAKTPKGEKKIVLRHDIDHDLLLSLNLARIEKKLGIKATYFVRLHAKGYHAFSLQGYSILKEILKMGHELGLHHDCDFADLFSEDPKKFLKRDKDIFENMIGEKVNGLSSHEPNKSKFLIQDGNLKEFGFTYQAYSDIFLKKMKYISDSSSRWREGCMHEWMAREEPRLCTLTIPIC